MVLQVLHPAAARDLLKGYVPTNEERARVDVDRRVAITRRKCPRPECGRALVARLPSNPSDVFDDDGVCYVAHCPAHGLIT
jgi:hypothetical protein